LNEDDAEETIFAAEWNDALLHFEIENQRPDPTAQVLMEYYDKSTH